MDEITLPEDLLGVGFAPQQAEVLMAMVYTILAEGGVVTSVEAGTGISVDATDPVAPVVSLDAASIASLALADSALQPGGVTVGDIDATGTPSASTYLRGDGSWAALSGSVESVVAGTGIAVDATDPVNPIVALSSGSQASLALADSAVQPGDLATVATTGAYADLSGTPTLGSLAALNSINNTNWSGTELSVANGGTGVSTLTQYGVLYGNGTGAVQATSVGTAGQVLTSNGAGVAPTFQSLSSTPGIIPLGSLVTASSSAALDFVLSGGYNEYILKFWQLKPTNDGASLFLRTSTNGGSSFDSGASDYTWYQIHGTSAATTVSGNNGSFGEVYLGFSGVGNAANEEGVSGEIKLYRPLAATYCNINVETTYTNSSGALALTKVVGRRNAAADVDAVRILFSSLTIASGYAQLYGVVTA